MARHYHAPKPAVLQSDKTLNEKNVDSVTRTDVPAFIQGRHGIQKRAKDLSDK